MLKYHLYCTIRYILVWKTCMNLWINVVDIRASLCWKAAGIENTIIYVCLCTFFVSTQSSCSNELMEVFSSPLPDPLSPQENASIGELGEWGNNCCMRYDRENQCPDFRSVFFFFSLIDPAAQYTGKTILFCILETGSYFPFPAGTIGEIK